MMLDNFMMSQFWEYVLLKWSIEILAKYDKYTWEITKKSKMRFITFEYNIIKILNQYSATDQIFARSEITRVHEFSKVSFLR